MPKRPQVAKCHELPLPKTADAEGLAYAEETASGKMPRKANAEGLADAEETASGEMPRAAAAEGPADAEGLADAEETESGKMPRKTKTPKDLLMPKRPQVAK